MDNKDQKDMFLSWLRDAHAMELSLVQNLEEQAKDADKENKLEVQRKIEAHLAETKRHAMDVESCLKRLGGSASATKDMIAKASGWTKGSMKSMMTDTMLKNALDSYADEHMEIAAYTSIIAAADELGDTETGGICARILDDEIRMADWLLTQIPMATRDVLKDQE